MKMGYFTLARKVDPRHKTNLWILSMTITLLIVRGSLTKDWGGSLVFSGGFFLSWALAREIDPLHEKSAFAAAFIYLFLGFWIADLSLSVVLWIVLLLRGITKIIGKTPTVIDLLGLIGLGIFLVLSEGNGIYGLIFTVAMGISYKRFPARGIYKVFIGMGVFLSVWGISSYSLTLREEALGRLSVPAVILLLGLVLGTFYGKMLQKDEGIRDDQGNLIKTKYVLWSYIFYLFTYVLLIIGTALEEGTVGLFFAVIFGVFLYRVGWTISKDN
jgi:hypothetical protein